MMIEISRFSSLAVSEGPASSSDQQNESAPFKLEATVPSRLALGARCGYNQRCWGSPVRQKKKHTGKHGRKLCVHFLFTCLVERNRKHRLYTATASTFSENQLSLYQTGGATFGLDHTCTVGSKSHFM